MAPPRGYKPLPGSERPPADESVRGNRIKESERVNVTILLHSRPGSPAHPDLEHCQDNAGGSRRFLTAEEWMDTYGAEEEGLRRVAEFLESNGLRVIEQSAGRRRVVAEGDARAVESAFSVTLYEYTRPDPVETARRRNHEDGPVLEVYRGFDGPVYLPSALLDVVRAVIGLDNRQFGHPAGVGTGDPVGSNYLTPDRAAQLYNMPNTGGAGETVGVFENAGAGAAYLHSDVHQFITGLSSAYRTQPASLNDIGLTVGATTYTNNTALVTPAPTGAVLECGLDVSIVAAVAQGVNINVYFTDTTEQGWDAFFDRALFPPSGDLPPSALTASWLFSLSDDSGSIGLLSDSSSAVSVLRDHLKTAAQRGITVFCAIGDWGSADLVLDGKCHVSYPASDPFVTACGGTILGDITSTGFVEFVWSEAGTASPFQNFPYESTGGGVSDSFPIPPFQHRAHLVPISNNDGNSRRGVPDVAGMVAMTGFFYAGNGPQAAFGTSLVAPLYAGLTAVINAFTDEQAGFLNPLLYRHGESICRDVTFGDNESGNPVPDAPVYRAGPGWDRCTGWGSIDGLRLRAAVVPAPIAATVVTGTGAFGTTCPGSFADEVLTIDNSGYAELLVSDITSTSPDFVVPTVASYPLMVAPGASIGVPIRFSPSSAGPKSTTLTIFSNDLAGTLAVALSGTGGAPRLVLAAADTGNLGTACVGSFADGPLVLSNSGTCPLDISGLTSSDTEFEVPEALTFPLVIAPGASLALPIRFAPTGNGPATTTITVTSNDPAGSRSIMFSGIAPTGKLAVTGSTYFGEVDCGSAERFVSVCNVGECPLDVTLVEFARPRRHFQLINNPFPATLRPGSCLGVVIRYEASCDPECCELVIRSDDPDDPVKRLDVVAFTRCKPLCECKPRPCGCQKQRCECC